MRGFTSKLSRTLCPSIFLTSTAFVDTKCERWGEPQTPVLQNPQQNFEKIKEDNSNGRKASNGKRRAQAQEPR